MQILVLQIVMGSEWVSEIKNWDREEECESEIESERESEIVTEWEWEGDWEWDLVLQTRLFTYIVLKFYELKYGGIK